MTSTFERVQAILVAKYSLAADAITPQSTLQSLGLDSLDLIELLFEVEDGFNIRIPQDGGTGLQTATVQDVVEMIDKVILEGPPIKPPGGH